MIRTNPDWRVWLGLVLTAAWLILGVIYISGVIGWQNLPFIGADDIISSQVFEASYRGRRRRLTT